MESFAVLASLVIILSTLLVGSNALDDFADEVGSFTFVYHDFNKLLLTLHGNDCFYTSVDTVPEAQLADVVGKLQLESQVVQKIQNNEASATTLAAMRDKYSDRLADFHCLDKNIFILPLQPQHTGPSDGIFDCSDVMRQHPHGGNGVHVLHVPDSHGHNHNFTAYCDQNTDGGGWTVFLNRKDGSEDFYRNWDSFENGFGSRSGEYWLGLWYLHALTSSGRNYELRVDIGDWDGSTAYAVYNVFRVDGPDTNYVLHVTGYHGTAGDSLDRTHLQSRSANGMQFSTYDRDHDLYHDSCAGFRHLAWWHHYSFDASPTGVYHTDGDVYLHHNNYDPPHDQGMAWYSWHNSYRPLKTMSMKIRPVV